MLTLSNEILMFIFSLCDSKTLCALSQVCKRYNQLISSDIVWRIQGQKCLFTNQKSREIKARSCCLLRNKEKCIISCNWTKTRFRRTTLIHHKKNYMPWIQLCSEKLWISQGKCISGFKHAKNGLIRNKEKVDLTSMEDACRFVLKQNTIVSGGSAGGIVAWSLDTEELRFRGTACHAEEINSIDYHLGMVISGSRDKTVKVWLSKESELSERHRISFTERVWSVAIDPLGNTFASGTSGTRADPLCIFDVQTGSILSRLKDNFVPGSGIFHIIHETPKSILTCGFDTIIRLWDLRTMKCVTKWTNPYDMAVLCLSSDQTNSFISGSGSSSLVCIWDKRKQNPVQAFYADSYPSPVYSVAFDPYHLFVSLDRSLRLLDFT